MPASRLNAFRLPSSIAAAGLLLLAAPSIGAQPACPAPSQVWVQCANGVRINAYEPAPDLSQWCEALAAPDQRLKPVRPGSPLYKLDADHRAMWIGLSGWQVLPREKGITDTPAGIAAFFREFGCTPGG